MKMAVCRYTLLFSEEIKLEIVYLRHLGGRGAEVIKEGFSVLF